MSNDIVQDELLNFIELLLDVQLISKEQASALHEFVLEGLPFYQDNSDLAQRIKDISSELASVTRPNMTLSEARNTISPQLVQKFLDLQRLR